MFRLPPRSTRTPKTPLRPEETASSEGMPYAMADELERLQPSFARVCNEKPASLDAWPRLLAYASSQGLAPQTIGFLRDEGKHSACVSASEYVTDFDYSNATTPSWQMESDWKHASSMAPLTSIEELASLEKPSWTLPDEDARQLRVLTQTGQLQQHFLKQQLQPPRVAYWNWGDEKRPDASALAWDGATEDVVTRFWKDELGVRTIAHAPRVRRLLTAPHTLAEAFKGTTRDDLAVRLWLAQDLTLAAKDSDYFRQGRFNVFVSRLAEAEEVVQVVRATAPGDGDAVRAVQLFVWLPPASTLVLQMLTATTDDILKRVLQLKRLVTKARNVAGLLPVVRTWYKRWVTAVPWLESKIEETVRNEEDLKFLAEPADPELGFELADLAVPATKVVDMHPFRPLLMHTATWTPVTELLTLSATDREALVRLEEVFPETAAAAGLAAAATATWTIPSSPEALYVWEPSAENDKWQRVGVPAPLASKPHTISTLTRLSATVLDQASAAQVRVSWQQGLERKAAELLRAHVHQGTSRLQQALDALAKDERKADRLLLSKLRSVSKNPRAW